MLPFSSPIRARITKGSINSNALTPIHNLFQAGRDYWKLSPKASSSTGAVTLGKRRRTTSIESDDFKTRSSLDLSNTSSTTTILSSPSQLPDSSSPVSSPSTVAHPSSSPSIVSSPSMLNQNSFIPSHPPPTPTPARRHARAALQNMDETYNAVVITALENIPFCCHEDLLTMSRSQLVAVARSLNTKLPSVMRIDISDQRTDFCIRKSIEVLVGISKPVGVTTSPVAEPPGAPKAVKTRRMHHAVVEDIDSSMIEGFIGRLDASMSEDTRMDISAWPPSSPGPLSSPLAKRAMIRSTRVARASELGVLATAGTPKLARLEEEDESISSTFREGTKEEGQQVKKRRKFSHSESQSRGKGFRHWSGSLVRRNEVSSTSLDSASKNESTMAIYDNTSPSKPQTYLRYSSLKAFPRRPFSSYQTRSFHNAYGASSNSPTASRSGRAKQRSRSVDVKSHLPDAFQKLAFGGSASEATTG